uniref:Peptidase S1 domain-containing protein n=1 Tax=Megaselia scalaris TaxID=36166 RepID=T1GJY7_MEGSC
FKPSFPIESRVVNGENAAPGQAPYIVSISSPWSTNYSHYCGGSIISKQWILTAAHCLTGSGPVRRAVFAGITNVADRAKGQEVIANYAYAHEKYSGGVGPYDIGLLHLETPLVFNDRVKPIALPYESEIVEGEASLYGWGQTNSSLPSPDPLQRVDTKVVEFKECKAALPSGANIHESNVCSSSLNSKVSACNGDSGGPFVKEDKNGVIQQIGIVSWGYVPCGEANLPSVYTRVSSYTEWIVQVQADYFQNRNFCKQYV